MWLIEPEFQKELNAKIDANPRPSHDVLATFAAKPLEASIVGTNGHIQITGVLSKTPSWYYRYLGIGNTVYSELINAINAVEGDSRIETVSFEIDSPGGEVCCDFYEAMDAIRNCSKPTTAVVHDLAASAGYGLASQVDKLIARGKGARFGSVGVVRTMYDDESYVEITSTNAPNKRPDPKTEEGRSAIVAELDAMHEMFVSAISKGRDVSAKTVNETFGQGGMFLASEALDRNMIDAIGVEKQPVSQELSAMDIEQLRAEHPAVYQAAVNDGVNQERDRVNAHMNMGESCGDMSIAAKAIKDGAELTQTLTAEYLAAGMRKKASNDRADEGADVEQQVENLDEKPNAEAEENGDKAFEAKLDQMIEGGV